MTARRSVLRMLEWDSRFFGLRIARTEPPTSPLDLDALLAAAREQVVDCLFCLVEANNLKAQWLLEGAGFVARDLRLEFQREVPPKADEQSGMLRRWTVADLDAMASLASTAFSATRYAADPRLPREAVARMYETWLRNSCAGFADEVLVLGSPGAAQGFVTLHVERALESARIGLIAMTSEARGVGAGRALVAGALDWARDQGCRHVSVVTQGNNVSAQRLYQRCSFLTHSAQLWFHAWPQ